jgi:hypothetical protein
MNGIPLSGSLGDLYLKDQPAKRIPSARTYTTQSDKFVDIT